MDEVIAQTNPFLLLLIMGVLHLALGAMIATAVTEFEKEV
jgi:hypothetical protein